MKQYNSILVEKDGPIATIYLNRPEQLNAFSSRMIDEIEEAVTCMPDDPEIRAVIFTGKGKAFCAGVDLRDASSIEKPIDSYRFLSRLQRMCNAVANLELPTIGAVNGLALGGGFELSLALDFLVASENAIFGVPEIKVGVLPGGGGMSRLPKKAGIPLAKRLVILGENLKAEEARSLGLIYRVVKNEEIMDEAKKLAQALAEKPQVCVRFAKKVLEKSERMSVYDAMDYEAHAAALLNDTEDKKEGMQAFLEKRKPVFKGR
ncbi:MAG TPA: enoyl-CoA hydratase/isomerase family protein [Bacillota bacterium]|nr:enoyl-CoA hydratase/isomerase family protein [Bacillota bacterium]